MAVTLMTTTGTLEDVQAALGVTPGSAPTQEGSTGPITASVESLSTEKRPPVEPAPPVESSTVPPTPDAAAAGEPAPAAHDDVPDSEFDEDGEPLTERAARSSRTKLQTIKKLRTRARTAETALAHANGELAALRRVQQTPPPTTETTQVIPEQAPPPAPDPHEPKEADFATYEGWIEARADFRARRAVREELAAAQQQHAATEQRRTVESRIKAFAESHADYYEKVNNPDLILTEPIALTLQASDDGPALAYALAQDVDRFKQIAAMPPILAIRALGELSAELRMKTPAAKAAPVTPPPPTPTAPPPPTPVRGQTVAATVSLEDFAKSIQPGDTKTSEWIRRRNEELARAGRR